ncbi:hypothetical protein [Streptomyces luteireticuli]|uniref:hypothetical protein n=1 Tax=Streptomyces luteireticuli TaxID=173858 RepID=UPI003557FF88
MDELPLDENGHPVGLTPQESRLASDYTYALDVLSRAARAFEHGQWTHVGEKAEELSQAAQALAASAVKAAEVTPCARTSSVLAAVIARGWRVEAVQRLHPGPYAQPREDDPAR